MDAIGLWRAARRRGGRTILVVGVGFDPRALVAVREFCALDCGDSLLVLMVGLPGRGGDARAVSLAEGNRRGLDELQATGGFRLEQVPFPEGIDGHVVGRSISQTVHERGFIGVADLVVVDISALPANIYFPLIGGILTAAESGKFRGDLQVVVCENPELDSTILAEGVTDPAPISGFISGLTQDARPAEIRVWAPVVGEGQGPQLEALYQYLDPREICPVLPFPARNPRRGDGLIVEHRQLLFDRMEIEPRNIIYADETNPFDVYRALCRLSTRYGEAVAPLGEAKIVTSVHGSKTLSLGVLLASWEARLPVVAAGPADYRLAPEADIGRMARANRLACLWLLGEPYR
jgi:hypothetical protein